MKKRISCIILSLVMLCSFAVGCSNSQGGSQETTGSSQTTESQSGSESSEKTVVLNEEEPVEMVYWVLGGSGGNREIQYQATADAYMEKHPNVNITIELEVGNQTERAQKLYTMLVSGSGPDVFHCNGIHVHDYATSDLIYPIEEFAEVKAEMQNFREASLEDASQDGILYALPIRANSVEFFWNKDHFREVGLDPESPPTTWEEFKEYAIKLTKKDENGNTIRYGAYPGFHSDLQQCAHFWYSLFFNLGGELVTDGKATFNSEAGVRSIQYWDELINELGVSPTDLIDGGFESGLVSMDVSGEWNILTYSDVPDLDFGFSRMPRWEESSEDMPVAGLGGQYLAIPSFVPEEKLPWAIDFILFSCGSEEQMRYVEAEIGTTGRTDVLDDPFFETETGQMYATAIDNLEYAKMEYAPEFIELSNLLGNALQEVILNGRDAQEALDEAATKYQEIYDQSQEE